MDKAQKAHAAEIGSRDNRIANLEKEVTRMGGTAVRTYRLENPA